MTLKRIISCRAYEHRGWFQIVWEWENILGNVLKIPIKTPGNKPFRLRRLLRYLGFPLFQFGTSVEFIMDGSPIDRRNIRRNTIPWIIDYFLSEEATKKFIQSLTKAPLVLISGKEAYERILSLGGNKLNIKHLALSLPDYWMPKSENDWNNKDYDLILIGRTSEGFTKYINRYIESHPNMSVAIRRMENGHYNFYSQKDCSVLVGNADTRDEYIKLLKRSRAFIYTTPGIDGDKSTNGLSQVTPRFLEALACGCNPVMKYADNADTRWYELSMFGPSVENYEDFERQMDKAISTSPNFSKISDYLSKHLTSIRAKELNEILSQI